MGCLSRLALFFVSSAPLVASVDTSITVDFGSPVSVTSQSGILEHRGELLPDLVGRVERIGADWDFVCQQIKTRTGVIMGPLGERNMRLRAPKEQARALPDTLHAMILDRYRRDFQLFYPDQLT